MFTLQRLEAALKRSISYPPDSCGEVWRTNVYRDWRQPRGDPSVYPPYSCDGEVWRTDVFLQRLEAAQIRSFGLWFILQINMIEKFEEQMFLCRDWRQPRGYTFPSVFPPDSYDGEVLSTNVSFCRDWRQPWRDPLVIHQIPVMEKFEEQMFTLQRLEAALKRSFTYPADS